MLIIHSVEVVEWIWNSLISLRDQRFMLSDAALSVRNYLIQSYFCPVHIVDMFRMCVHARVCVRVYVWLCMLK